MPRWLSGLTTSTNCDYLVLGQLRAAATEAARIESTLPLCVAQVLGLRA